MIEGVLRHCTEMAVDRQYVDSHGQSEVAFAFSHLLGFQLLPRLKAIHAQRLYRADAGQPDAFPHLQPVLSRPIQWDLILQQYDEMIKYASALRLGTADTEQGFWLCTKRWSQGRLQWWPRADGGAVPLAARELQVLLWNGCPERAAMADDWRQVA